MEQLQQLKQWYFLLPVKEQWMVSGTGIFIAVTLFYLMLWEPVHLGLDSAQQKQLSQQDIILWMQQASTEVKTLRASGSKGFIRDKNKPVNLVIETTLTNAGLKSSLKKIESSGNKGTRVTLDDAAFNQILVWLNTMATFNNIHVVSANIERSSKAGRADARLTFERP